MKRKVIFSFILLLSSFTVAAQPSGYHQWVQQSIRYIDGNKLDSAAFALQKAMSSDPANANNTVLLLNLGILQRQLQLYDDAYISFTASLNGSNNSTLVLHNRASLLVNWGRYDEAMEDYDAILQKDSADVEAYYRRGLLFLEKGNRPKAEADFSAAERSDSRHLFTKLSRALLYKLDDNWGEAEKIYSDIISTEKEVNSAYYLNRAECYLNTAQVSKAAADIHAIERDERENPYFYLLRGRLRLEQFDKFAANADFVKAKQLGYDPEIADQWIRKAR